MYATMAALKAAISAETGRNDATFVARFGDFVKMAEARIYHGDRPLRCREMETRELSLTVTAGAATVPTGFLEARRLTWNATPPVNMTYREPEEFYGLDYYGATPFLFTIEGTVLDVKPSASGTVTLSYYAKPTPLDADMSTNAVLAAHGQVYLFAALIEAYEYLRNYPKRDASVQRFLAAIDGINMTAAKARYAGTRLSPRIRGAVR